jgi:hypothetical protein
MSGSETLLKKLPSAVNMSVLVKLVMRPTAASAAKSPGESASCVTSDGKRHTYMQGWQHISHVLTNPQGCDRLIRRPRQPTLAGGAAAAAAAAAALLLLLLLLAPSETVSLDCASVA